GRVTVAAVGGLGTSTQLFKVQPAISGFAPDKGFATQIITVNGTGFFGAVSAKVNGVAAAVSAVAPNGTSLHVTIPAAVTHGTIPDHLIGGTATSAADLTGKPELPSFAPAAAVGGANVTINGTGLGGTTVDFTNSLNALIVTHTGTSIVVKVPVDAHNGPITVHTAGGDSTSVASFKPLTKILSFDKANYQVGGTVTVNGSNFLATGLNPTVKVGTNIVMPTLVTDTSIQLTIPANAVTAAVSAANTNGTATSPTTLKIRPTITGDPAPNE